MVVDWMMKISEAAIIRDTDDTELWDSDTGHHYSLAP